MRLDCGPLGEVAQSVEHTAENRGVAGSIPALATRARLAIPAISADAGKAGIGELDLKESLRVAATLLGVWYDCAP